MRLTQLTENANVDVSVLSTVAELILSWLPSIIPADESIKFERLSPDSQKIKTIISKFPEEHHSLVLHLLTRNRYVFNNTKEHVNSSEVGVHVTDHRTKMTAIVINISAFVNSYDAIRRDDLLKIKKTNTPFKTIKSVLIHEMRHGQQYHNYGGHPDSERYSYSTDPDEIDAAWLHHLLDYDVDDYDNAIDYVRSVMSSFEVYKSLTDKQQKHYLKKTASYWYEHKNPSKEHITPSEKLKKNKVQRINDLLNEVTNISNKDGVNDLRTYPGYPQDATNFLLPLDNLIKALHVALTSDNKYSGVTISYLYAFLALLNRKFNIDVSVASSVFGEKYSITSKQASGLIREKGFGKFGSDYFSDLIDDVF